MASPRHVHSMTAFARAEQAAPLAPCRSRYVR